MEGKTTQALWQDYYFLTKEMFKFLTKQDMELFYNLMEQRGRLQKRIEQTADDGFKDSLTGQSLLTEIQNDNQSIIMHLQMRRNRFKQHHNVMEVYNGSGSTYNNKKNWQR